MTTKAPSMLVDTAHAWEDTFSSAIFAGIVGDINHPDGYHISYEDNPSGNYSVTRSCDHPPNMPTSLEEYASAIDMSMNTTDMKTCYDRVMKVYNDKTDPRRRYFNAFNGWNGSGDAKRVDFIANVIGYATSDHKSHSHCEMPRCYCMTAKAGRAWISTFKGESKQTWTDREEDMTVTDPDAEKIAKKTLTLDGVIDNPKWRGDHATNPKIQLDSAVEIAMEVGHEASVAAAEAVQLGKDNAAALARIEAAIAAGPLPQPTKGKMTGDMTFTPDVPETPVS
jgi:hypothetical protein